VPCPAVDRPRGIPGARDPGPAGSPAGVDDQVVRGDAEAEAVAELGHRAAELVVLERDDVPSSKTTCWWSSPPWADSLGPEDSDGATYLQSIASNTRALVDGLTAGAVACSPPAD
jgi:hypothetical protein